MVVAWGYFCWGKREWKKCNASKISFRGEGGQLLGLPVLSLLGQARLIVSKIWFSSETSGSKNKFSQRYVCEKIHAKDISPKKRSGTEKKMVVE